MIESNLIPPKLKRPSFRETLVAALFGAAGGAVLGVAAWLATGDANWFWIIPLCGAVGIWVRRARPNVLWGHRAS